MIKNKKLLFSAVALTVAASAYAQQEQMYTVENLFRVGYDDNTNFSNSNRDSSAFFSDVFNLGALLRFDGSTELNANYQGEFVNRPGADPENLMYHDAYVRFSHELSENVGMVLSDSFRYQQRDAQSGATANANFIENALRGALNMGVDDLTEVRVGGGFVTRQWDEDSYGVVAGNNYDQYAANLSVYRTLKEETQGMLGVDYSTTEYDGNRGSMDVVSLMGGVEHSFGTKIYGYGRVGASFIDTETAIGDSSTTAPYLSTGLDYTASDKTSFNGSFGYMTRAANNSTYNAQEQASLSLGMKNQLSAKVGLVSALTYNMGSYKSDYARFGAADADDNFLKLSVRGSYEVTDNNFVEIGYEYSDRDTDLLGASDYDRNRVDIGWRWKM
jgi:hypothetical protein